MKWKHFRTAFIVGAAFIAFAFFSSPGGVVVDETGNVEGLLEKTRLVLQGKRFWKQQLQNVQAELSREESWSYPELMAKIERTSLQNSRNIEATIDKLFEKIYAAHPELRPSAETLQANALRAQAAQLEEADLSAKIESKRLRRIAELRRILIIVKSHVE
ncbi:MAG: hypothetical protein A2107_06715 [Verrucomicrobia bacterium GWF2_62_7]|nr:MAG: hypothetical protein A2107_06715 [Verrucomicrobia bacterium GWF2_62_7]